MLEVIRNWVNVLLCLGIFIIIIKLFLPQNKMKKYVLSILGVITVISIVSPLIDVFKSGELERSIKSVISDIDETNTEDINESEIQKSQQDTVKNSFMQSIKTDIINKLKAQNVTVNKIEIFMNDNYDIEKLQVNIEKLEENENFDSVNKVMQYINNSYGIEFSKIEVVEE